MSDVTQILAEVEAGDLAAAEKLFPIVYQELRRLAQSRMQSERSDHTLQATALVNEVYLRLVDGAQVHGWESRAHFFATAAEAMRRILVEHARRKLSKRRGGDYRRIDIGEPMAPTGSPPETLLQVSEALDRLAELDPQTAELVKLHCFGGFAVNEAAQMLGISRSCAYRHWAYAKAIMGKLLK